MSNKLDIVVDAQGLEDFLQDQGIPYFTAGALGLSWRIAYRRGKAKISSPDAKTENELKKTTATLTEKIGCPMILPQTVIITPFDDQCLKRNDGTRLVTLSSQYPSSGDNKSKASWVGMAAHELWHAQGWPIKNNKEEDLCADLCMALMGDEVAREVIDEYKQSAQKYGDATDDGHYSYSDRITHLEKFLSLNAEEKRHFINDTLGLEEIQRRRESNSFKSMTTQSTQRSIWFPWSKDKTK